MDHACFIRWCVFTVTGGISISYTRNTIKRGSFYKTLRSLSAKLVSIPPALHLNVDNFIGKHWKILCCFYIYLPKLHWESYWTSLTGSLLPKRLIRHEWGIFIFLWISAKNSGTGRNVAVHKKASVPACQHEEGSLCVIRKVCFNSTFFFFFFC